MGQLFSAIVNRGVFENDDPILKRKKVVFNIFNLIGTLVSIPQILMLYPFDHLSAYAFIAWGVIAFTAYLLMNKLPFKTLRNITLFSILIMGSIGSMRTGPDLYPHIASFGILFAAFIFYDLRKEWLYLALFTLIEISAFILTEFSVFQVTEVVVGNETIHRIFILSGTLLFLILELYIFKDVVTRSEHRANNALKKLNSEKDVLLKEIHHRVKNNLQLLQSLINLKNRQRDISSEEVLEDVSNRIRSIAMLHNKVYIQNNAESIHVEAFVQDLLDDLNKSLAPETNISLDFQTDLKQLDVNHMVPLTLILNELVTNSFKHGLSDKMNGTIKISIEQLKSQNDYCLTYKDDGVWKENNTENGEIGLSLISSFADQLDGSFELKDAKDKNKKVSQICFSINSN